MFMKKVYIVIAVVLFAAASVATVLAIRSNNRKADFFNANVEALTKDEANQNNGALWSDPTGTKYCCGPGNVRDCSTSGVPEC